MEGINIFVVFFLIFLSAIIFLMFGFLKNIIIAITAFCVVIGPTMQKGAKILLSYINVIERHDCAFLNDDGTDVIINIP